MKPKQVMIVDDHAELRKLVRMTLEYENYEITEADNGDRAIEALAGRRPDVVILDVMMPGTLDGYQVCERIKSDAELRGTHVILLTARGQKADIERGRKVGADTYLVKPFSPLELIDTVERALTHEAA